MKTKLILTICLLFVIMITKAQVTDTAAYVQQIIASKNNYIGKPFSVLEKDLKLQIKFFSPFADITYDMSKETSTSFGFIKPRRVEGLYEEDMAVPTLWISWTPYLDAKKSHSLYNKNDGGGWTAEVDSFYRNGIIKDIDTLP